MQKIPIIFLFVLLLCSSCNKEDDSSKTNFLLGEIDITLSVGDKIALSERFEPYDRENTVVWLTTDPDIVTVSSNGDIIAVGVGKTDILIIATLSGMFGICHVTVLERCTE
ncbi:MAG: Ig-like domain-containing protein [Cytophagaceae bacterium]|nr:Ig-like domain-containing protein [Cytophagaceae bacterium]